MERPEDLNWQFRKKANRSAPKEQPARFEYFQIGDQVVDGDGNTAEILEMLDDKILLRGVEDGVAYHVSKNEISPADFDINSGDWVMVYPENKKATVLKIDHGVVHLQDEDGNIFKKNKGQLGEIKVSNLETVDDLAKMQRSPSSRLTSQLKQIGHISKIRSVGQKMAGFLDSLAADAYDYEVVTATENMDASLVNAPAELLHKLSAYLVSQQEVEDNFQIMRNRRDQWHKDQWQHAKSELEKKFKINIITEHLLEPEKHPLPNGITKQDIKFVEFVRLNRLGALNKNQRDEISQKINNLIEKREPKAA